MKMVTATEANRDFSKLLELAASGEAIAITRHGKVVARIVPEVDTEEEARKDRAFNEHLEVLRSQPLLGVKRGTRDEVYED